MSTLQEYELAESSQLTHTGHHRAVPQHHESGHEGELVRPTRTYSRSVILVVFVLMSAMFAGLFLLGWIPRRQLTAKLEAASERIRTAAPEVRVIKPRASAAIAPLMLPGDVQAMEEITIYPRTTGYLKHWHVDIGDEVEEGQLLAEIDTPEVQAQLQQSQAQLAESKASLERARATVKLSQINAQRIRGLVEKRAVAQQELDDADNALDVAVANEKLGVATVNANSANVQHTQELLTFCAIRSSFAGTVVARYVDTGKLVTSGNGTGQALFKLARTNPVRVFINVPQNFAPGVSKGLKANVIAREIPGRMFEGVVTRTARAIDPVTRTLLTEIQVTNEDHALLTGSYVQVQMDVSRPHSSLVLPSSSLIFNASGNQIAVVGEDNVVELRSVAVAEDFGREIGIATGISPDDQIVITPGDRLTNGMKVTVVRDEPTTTTKPAAQSSTSSHK